MNLSHKITNYREQHPIDRIGSIQPHGMLFVLGEPELTIIQASKNTDDHYSR